MAAASTSALRLPPMPSIRDILRIYGVTANKRLAQNFLLNPNVCSKFVYQIKSHQLDGAHICEVGPGPGGITREILRSKAAHLLAIEKDRRFLPSLDYLRASLSDQSRFDIVVGDVMDFDFSDVFPPTASTAWHADPPPIFIVGNLPFNISTPLIIKWLQQMYEREGPFSYGRVRLTLSFQKEVAQRLLAMPQRFERCRLSLIAQCYAHMKYAFEIPNTTFTPIPKVDAAVVKFMPRVRPQIELPFKLLEKVFRHTFHYRRKNISTPLQTLFPGEYAKEFADRLLQAAKIKGDSCCSMDLDMDHFRELAHTYDELCKKTPGLYHYEYRNPKSLELLATEKGPFPPKYKWANEDAIMEREVDDANESTDVCR